VPTAPHRKSAVALTIASLITLSGCSGPSGPTTAEAARTLKADVTRLLATVGARSVRITADGSRDVPCGHGKAQRSYGVTATENAADDDPTQLVLNMVGSLTGRYTTIRWNKSGVSGPSTDLRNSKAHTNLSVGSPGRGTIEVTGRTDCLRTG
jgi:hypothetical protein